LTLLLHAVYGLAGAIIGTVLLVTGHIDAATGIALIVGSLGIGSTAAVANNAVNQANQTVPMSALPSGVTTVNVSASPQSALADAKAAVDRLVSAVSLTPPAP
jgi:hypothetical protein